ncbi:lanthionine synthetase LanC family protein [Streptosporangium sp. NPDC051022]|uniref:lanthionine synthetase LanC family protein n=1 Tax=Streptosporangium sp. NPDC051022 TaxID=3155752 RepID=UPI0034483AE2
MASRRNAVPPKGPRDISSGGVESRAGRPRTLRPRRPHWCSGSSGIGSFLIRYWKVTGDPESFSLAVKAATAVHRVRWQLGSVPCHGLPGEGRFPLDMADFTADDRYHRWARDLARCLEARAVTRSGGLLVPDPVNARVNAPVTAR